MAQRVWRMAGWRAGEPTLAEIGADSFVDDADVAALPEAQASGALALLLGDGAQPLLVFPAIDLGGAVVLGDGGQSPGHFDLECCGIVTELNGVLAGTGAGAAALGHPLRALAAAKADLREGDLVILAELTPPVAARSGDAVRVSVGGLGSAGVRLA